MPAALGAGRAPACMMLRRGTLWQVLRLLATPACMMLRRGTLWQGIAIAGNQSTLSYDP